jgi:hypothetical protein
MRWQVAKIPQSMFKMSELTLGVEEAPPLQVVWEGAAASVEVPARGARGSLGTAGRRVTSILIELLLCHHLNHVLDVWSKDIGSQWVGGNVSYLIHNILKDIKVHGLDESI